MKSKLKRLEFYRNVAIDNGNFDKFVNKTITDSESLANSIHNNVRIEGNTVSYNDTLKLLIFGAGTHEILNKYKKEEILDIEGFKNATIFSYNNIGINNLSDELIRNIHSLAYGPIAELHKGLLPGQYRNYPSYTYRVDGTIKEYLDYRLIYDSMENLIFYYRNSNGKIEDICKLKLDFIHIHPFGDGNGRVSRIILNWALISSGYIPIIVEWKDKREYIDSMDYYGTTGKGERFMNYIVSKLERQYKDLLS